MSSSLDLSYTIKYVRSPFQLPFFASTHIAPCFALALGLVRRGFLPENVVRYGHRPFDNRWFYWEPETKLVDEKRADYVAEVAPSNVWLAAAQRVRRAFDPPFVTRLHASRHLIERGANLFPLRIKHTLFSHGNSAGDGFDYNLSVEAAAYAERFSSVPDYLFYHCISVLHSRQYGADNSSAMLQDWPRIPLPKTKDALEHSAELGRRVAALLDTERPVPTVSSGKIRRELLAIAIVSRLGGGSLKPDSGDLEVTAGWGHAGKTESPCPARAR